MATALVGEVSFGGTYIYTGRYQSVADQCQFNNTQGCNGLASPGTGILPGTHVLKANATWEGILGTPIDASAFVTNITNEVVYLSANDNVGNRGFLSSLIGEPRVYGFRLRYRFGN